MRKDSLFFASLLTVTLAPLMGLPLTAGYEVPGLPFLLALTGAGHLASTAIVIRHSAFSRIIRDNPGRFVWYPLALVGLFVAFQQIGGVVWDGALATFFAWQFYHYQRQNYGIVAFTAANSEQKVPAGLGLALNLAALAGVLGYIGQGFMGQELPAFRMAVYWLGVVLAIAAAVWALIAGRSLSGWMAAFSAVSALFFLPVFLSDNIIAAFWSYAMAHGAQYLIFAMIMHDPQGLRRLVLTLVLWLGAFAVFTGLNHAGMMGAYVGFSCWHFLIDAKLWRLREPVQRATIREQFGFVFPR